VGIRRSFGEVLVSATYVGARSYDGLVFNWANITWKYFGTDSSACCSFGGGHTASPTSSSRRTR